MPQDIDELLNAYYRTFHKNLQPIDPKQCEIDRAALQREIDALGDHVKSVERNSPKG